MDHGTAGMQGGGDAGRRKMTRGCLPCRGEAFQGAACVQRGRRAVPSIRETPVTITAKRLTCALATW